MAANHQTAAAYQAAARQAYINGWRYQRIIASASRCASLATIRYRRLSPAGIVKASAATAWRNGGINLAAYAVSARNSA